MSCIKPLAESKFVSSFDRIEARDRMVAAEAATLGDGCWRRDRERKTYGIFDFAECSKLRLACRSYYINFRSSNVIGAERLRSLFSPYKGTRVNLLAARPRVCYACLAVRMSVLISLALYSIFCTCRSFLYTCLFSKCHSYSACSSKYLKSNILKFRFILLLLLLLLLLLVLFFGLCFDSCLLSLKRCVCLECRIGLEFRHLSLHLLSAQVTNTSWILTRRCFANMAIR